MLILVSRPGAGPHPFPVRAVDRGVAGLPAKRDVAFRRNAAQKLSGERERVRCSRGVRPPHFSLNQDRCNPERHQEGHQEAEGCETKNFTEPPGPGEEE